MIFDEWTTPLLADACVRARVPLRLAPSGLRPVLQGMRCIGPVRPAQHVGSVDVFLEAIERAAPGEVLVVDDGGRRDRGCVGDLTALECQGAGLAALVVWGAHRDTAELQAIGLPTFSYGSLPAGPTGADPRPPDALERASFGDFTVSTEDVVAADADGALFVPRARLEELAELAREIGVRERAQAELVRSGTSLRDQLGVRDYLTKRARDPDYDFRKHLRARGGAIEE